MEVAINKSVIRGLEGSLDLNFEGETKHQKPIVNTEIFDKMLSDVLREGCDDRYYKLIRFLCRKYTRSVQVTRTDLTIGSTIFEEADNLLRRYSFPKVDESLLAVSRLPALAYLQYKRKEDNLAIQTLKVMLDIDLYLAENKKFDVLVYHRIQQVHNLARIQSRIGGKEEWKFLNLQILMFLLGGQNRFEDSNWDFDVIRKLPEDLRVLMSIQVLSELVSVAFKLNAHQEVMREVLAEIEVIAFNVNGLSLGFWLQAKQSILNHDVDSFLFFSNEFLTLLPQDPLMQSVVFRKSLLDDYHTYIS